MIRSTGQYESTTVTGAEVQAFVPNPLPVRDPAVQIEGSLSVRLVAAERALSRLDLAAHMVPSVDWFLYAFVRKEAVLSSQIEGTQATLIDLLNFESGNGQASPDINEVCNYVDALKYAREQLASTRGLPLSMRLLNETHRLLMRGVRGAGKAPGEVRRTQNWIGGSRPGNAAFVPPPPDLLPKALEMLEKYIHGKDSLSPVIRAGLVHVQFETIHPYLDGNGRIGRLLISLLFEHWKLLAHPLLYLSLFFRRHQAEYYRRLSAVRTDGDWEGWLDFFLDGVATVGEETLTAARELFVTVTTDRERVLSESAASVAALRLFEALPVQPIVTVAAVMRVLVTTKPTAGRAIEALRAAGVLIETTGRRRGRSFAYQRYLDLLSAGTDLK
ncbi:MAG: Fic family protein [Steroidobacteraceae bacterium]